jgi:hypothetical protein
MRWRLKVFGWRTAVRASPLSTHDCCECQDAEWPTLTAEQLLDRCQRASRLTC